MFFVIDKSKILSYIVAVCTVLILFVAAANLQQTADNTLTTSTNALSESNFMINTINIINEVD